MTIILLGGGFFAGVILWAAALRPHLVARGKQTTGVSFFQAMLSDLSNAKELGKEGDLKAKVLARAVTFCLCAALLGMILVFVGGQGPG